jgi:hypothetical protein
MKVTSQILSLTCRPPTFRAAKTVLKFILIRSMQMRPPCALVIVRSCEDSQNRLSRGICAHLVSSTYLQRVVQKRATLDVPFALIFTDVSLHLMHPRAMSFVDYASPATTSAMDSGRVAEQDILWLELRCGSVDNAISAHPLRLGDSRGASIVMVSPSTDPGGRNESIGC